jgi:hypothetical protein
MLDEKPAETLPDYSAQAAAALVEKGELTPSGAAKVSFLEASGEATIRAETLNRRLNERTDDAEELKAILRSVFTNETPPYGTFTPFVEVLPSVRIDNEAPVSWKLSVLRVPVEEGLPVESVITGQATDKLLVFVERPKTLVHPDLWDNALPLDRYTDARVVTVPHGTKPEDLRVAEHNVGENTVVGTERVRAGDIMHQVSLDAGGAGDVKTYRVRATADEDLTMEMFERFVDAVSVAEQQHVKAVTETARERRDRLEASVVEINKGNDALGQIVASVGRMQPTTESA